MNKIITCLIVLFTLLAVNLNAQQDASRKKRIEEYRKKHIAYIEERVHLTQTQSEKFWPIYNEFQDKKILLLRPYRKKVKAFNTISTPSDEEYQDIVMEGLETKKREIELTQQYYSKFQEILSPQELYDFNQAEESFNKEYLKRKIVKEGEKSN